MAAKVKRKAVAQPLEIAADFGPKHQRATPLALILKAPLPEEVPGRLAVVDAPEPDAPNRTVRRARVRYHYDELHARGGLTDGEREAADCWLVLREMEAGGRNRPDISTGRTPPWLQGHPTITQVQAAAKLRNAHQAIGIAGQGLMIAYVERNEPASAIATKQDASREQVMGRIRAALTRLAELWGMD